MWSRVLLCALVWQLGTARYAKRHNYSRGVCANDCNATLLQFNDIAWEVGSRPREKAVSLSLEARGRQLP